MDTYSVSVLSVGALLGFICYRKYFPSISKWFNTKRQHAKLLLTVMGQIKEDISTNKHASASFEVNNTDTSANIVYERLGTQYIMMVPYNRTYAVHMSQFKVELLRTGSLPIDITQQPGIPYIIDADSLGGYGIKISNSETGLVHEYVSAPMYGVEVMDFE